MYTVKKLLLLSALFIFACSSVDNSLPAYIVEGNGCGLLTLMTQHIQTQCMNS